MKKLIIFMFILTLTLLGTLALTWPVVTSPEGITSAAPQDEACSHPVVLDIAAQAAVTQAVVVDVYQSMNSNSLNDTLLTPGIMEPSSYSSIGGVNATWIIDGSMWVSTDYVRQFPDAVIVNGTDRSVLSTRTWKFSDKYKGNFVTVLFGDSPRQDPYPPYYDYMTIACYYTPGSTGVSDSESQHDSIIIGGPQIDNHNIFAVLQTLDAGDGPYIQAHAEDENGTTISPINIKVVTGKTYWVNLYNDGPAGEVKVAVFDPDNGWKQVGQTVVAKSIVGAKMRSRAKFGRVDTHGSDLLPQTYSYFSHIMIDYTNVATEVVFPLLPKIPNISNLELHGRPGNKAIYLDWTANVTIPVTTTWHIEYYTTTTTAPFTITNLISSTRSATLTDHVQNSQLYTVTLYAMPGKWLSDTVQVMPTDRRFVYLPLVLK